MPLPTIEAIKTTLENDYASCIHDPSLSGYKPIPGLLGPMFYPGGFGVVFPLVNANNHKYAFRVWHREIPGIKERTEKIAKYLESINLPYFVEFDFVSGGLTVNDDSGNQDVDTVRMEWVEGYNLHDYLTNSKEEDSPAEFKKNTKKLAENFKSMFKDLHQADISHGDLQHGNVIILNNLDIKLVDYDSVFVPTIRGEKQITCGLTGYQHPIRKETCSIASEKDDYFSELVIYCTLLAISLCPDLWPDDEDELDNFSLVLTENDFNNISSETKGHQITERNLTNIKSSPSFARMVNITSSDPSDVSTIAELRKLLVLLVNYLNVDDLSLIKPMPGTAKSKKKKKYSEQDQTPQQIDVPDLISTLESLSDSPLGKSKQKGYTRITKTTTKVEKTDEDTRKSKYHNQ